MILCGYDLSYKNDNDIGDLIVKLQGKFGSIYCTQLP